MYRSVIDKCSASRISISVVNIDVCEVSLVVKARFNAR